MESIAVIAPTFPPEQHPENLSPTRHRSAEGAIYISPPRRGWRARAAKLRAGRLAQ